MTVKIDGLTHATPEATPGKTRCGLDYDPADYNRGVGPTCPECQRIGTRQFLSGWDRWAADPKNVARARRDDAREARARGEAG